LDGHLKYSYNNFKHEKDDFMGGKARDLRHEEDKKEQMGAYERVSVSPNVKYPEEEVLLTKSQLENGLEASRYR
jgi:hypothetical protein